MAKTAWKLYRSQLPVAKQQTSLRSVLLRPTSRGCLTSQMLPKFGEDFSTRGGEIRPLSWGRGHRLAVLFFLWILAWHVDSWKTGVAENPETRGELDASCQRLRDDHTSS